MFKLHKAQKKIFELDRAPEPLLQFELFSLDQLQRHARELASKHRVGFEPGVDWLLPRLASNEALLSQVYERLSTTVRSKTTISPAAEWLLDNFHLIEDQIRTAKRHLPRGYSRSLPHLMNPGSDGKPRVYDLALEIIAHVDGRIDRDNITAFVSAYQEVTPLTLGEFWAIPIMLRLALIENIRRVASRVGTALDHRACAVYWGERLLDTAEHDPKNIIVVVADMARTTPPLSNAFVAELIRRLQGHSTVLELTMGWLSQQLTSFSRTVQQMIQAEGQQQAANQVSVSSSIASLRFLSSMDWCAFVESMSLVTRILRQDPAAVYDRMDFVTRDSYRHVVERLAKYSGLTESEVAQHAVNLATAHAETSDAADRKSHIGYYLVDEGYPTLKRLVRHLSNHHGADLYDVLRNFGRYLFAGQIFFLTLLFTLIIIRPIPKFSLSLGFWILLTGAIAILSSQLALELVNLVVTNIEKPKFLPRLDFSRGIPQTCRTLVCIPSMLINKKNVHDLIAGLELRFLANRDPNLYFALLTDFADASSEVTPTDDELSDFAREGIQDLNDRYRSVSPDGNVGGDIFFLFHRAREWNEREKTWMGYERKRGKLAALNALLRGRPGHLGIGHPDFSIISGDTGDLLQVKYVITLDTDTQLPRDTVKKLVGNMAHPLNRPEFCLDKSGKMGCVAKRGYSILQPRVAVSLPSSSRSLYARLYTDDPGVDPYTRAISDVYQDLFNEGSFIGKGIYDVDAFSHALATNLPENMILSHDLIEGCYGRCGLVSDVILYEDHPSHYCDDALRRHRWIRGDWQISCWLLPRVPVSTGKWQTNPLSVLSRWKIFDNLRRSLVPISVMVILLIGWMKFANFWYLTEIALLLLFLPVIVSVISEGFNKHPDIPLKEHIKATAKMGSKRLARTVLALVFLPFESLLNVDAIFKSMIRLVITRRHLLAWRSATDPRNIRDHGFLAACRVLFVGPILALLVLIIILVIGLSPLKAASPFLALWFFSPIFGFILSGPIRESTRELDQSQKDFLRRLARRTWRYFEVFVGPEDNWLPPDNYQEFPLETIAHRTSPTNIGMSLLANLAAFDLGYISASMLASRTSLAFKTLDKIERFRGHFFNWYDTQTLKPLIPQYVSTVDSGNFAGLVLTLGAGLKVLGERRIIESSALSGLRDTANCLRDLPTLSVESKSKLAHLLIDLESPIATLKDAKDRLQKIKSTLIEMPHNEDEEVQWWTEALRRQSSDVIEDVLVDLAPWCLLPETTNASYTSSIFNLDEILTFQQTADLASSEVPAITELLLSDQKERDWLLQLQAAVKDASSKAAGRIKNFSDLAGRCALYADCEYEFLYDRSRHLLAIGYNVSDHRRDESYYDLLASEARLGSFVAIAQGHLPQEHWFAMGRILTAHKGEPTLLSWSGSMFEYLMPLLVMPNFSDTLLDQSYRAAVRRQIEYGAQRNVPWGISESGYMATDIHLNYQYRAFGVPGLGFKRGLSEDLVVAPYASVMALMVAPYESCNNLQMMAEQGFMGRYGFYEAVDYTTRRLEAGNDKAVVKSFMAHHEGMSLLAIVYQLLNKKMQQRFLSLPLFKSTELLLHERVPKASVIYPHAPEVSEASEIVSDADSFMRVIHTPDTPRPEVHLLSNGRYAVMVTNAGGGYSCWQDLAITRWHEDPTCDDWGTFCYLKDVDNGDVWSAAFQPTRTRPLQYEAIFTPSKAEFRRRDRNFELHTEITVSPEDDIELRRFTITNLSGETRTVELTSYAEVVLAPKASDAAHPAFSNLFIQTRIIANRNAIICTRRPRSTAEKTPAMMHLMTIHGAPEILASFDTDRASFLGRGRSASDPRALDGEGNLAGHEGSVLDPIIAVRCRITLKPEQTIKAHMVTGVGETEKAALDLIEKYHDAHIADRVFDLAWTHQMVEMRQFNITASDAQIFGRLASSVIYSNSARRANTQILAKNRRGQDGLWGHGISGDLPIVLLKVSSDASMRLVRELVQAHGYWRRLGLTVELLIWNEDESGYRQQLQDQIMAAISLGAATQFLDRPGGIFIRRSEHMAEEDRILMQTVARVVITERDRSLADLVKNRGPTQVMMPLLRAKGPFRSAREQASDVIRLPKGLIFANKYGGFSADGREYYIKISKDNMTPMPWVNVIANPSFGTVVSESGSSYSWCENAHEFRLSPWHNDAVTDRCGEVVYLRDEESGMFWSTTLLPSPSESSYLTCHGFGYSRFSHVRNGISSELTMFVAIDAPVKILKLKLRNLSDRNRRISFTCYCEWVLGELRTTTMSHIISEFDLSSGSILARNPYHSEFGGRIGFLNVSEKQRTVTGDRTEFIGRNGSLASPLALLRRHLSGRTGAALDPCAAMQSVVELDVGEDREIVFVLGVGRDLNDVHTLLSRFGTPSTAQRALEDVQEFWQNHLSRLQIRTNDPSVDLLANGWLIYQMMSSRIWARSGYYQSGGAYGFRDQLQDTMALLHTNSQLLREQILRCAARQFHEGDVQHWWHPPSGRGTRTHFSDDYLWLPLATSRYVLGTGDIEVLDVKVGFIEGRQVKPDEEGYSDIPKYSDESATLYDHCVRAVTHGFRYGQHGLPLIGCGDWNDGMNLVGERGKGESVWLGFFFFDVLKNFARIAERRGDQPFADLCLSHANSLRANLEVNGWDGEWYLRAYFDDGKALGSSINPECQIDSLPQSWAVLSGAGDRVRAAQGMRAVEQRLVDREQRIIKLFDPPFDKSEMNPGYIKGYVPGVRENGGQYTHAAIWTAMAFAEIGDTALAWELFSIINPLQHAMNDEAIARYKVEPYVVAADVYAVPPHGGRGGWTWYTGSAGWMYRLIIESLLGIRREGESLYFSPKVPHEWPGFEIKYRYLLTDYEINFYRSVAMNKTVEIFMDGRLIDGDALPLVDDRIVHTVKVLY